MKPFLKWAGNKYQIINRIKEILPAGKRLIEPFVGSGALFLNTMYSDYLLADANPDLINLYQYLQRDGQKFIDYCRPFFLLENNQNTTYYEFRSLFNSTTDTYLKSALFLYLNKHCYNGLCRYNASGGFNVPFGRNAKPYFPELEMQFFYHHSQSASIQLGDFVDIMSLAESGDVVYCDPPYVPLSSTAHFTSYSVEKFGLEKQIVLSKLAETLASKRITVVISNHYTEFTSHVYSSAKLITFDVRRQISCNGNNRNKASEVLAVFGA